MAGARRDWFARMVLGSFEHGIQDADGLIAHTSPAVLVHSLSRDQLAAILGGALQSGQLTPTLLVDALTLEVLAEVLPDDILWASVRGAADAAGLDADSPATGSAADFLVGALVAGFDAGQVVPGDVLRHASPSILTRHLPATLSAKLLEASLAAGSMNADLVLKTLPPDVLAEHLPASILWGCIASCAGGGDATSNASGDAEPTAAFAHEATPEEESGLDELEPELVDEHEPEPEIEPEIEADFGGEALHDEALDDEALDDEELDEELDEEPEAELDAFDDIEGAEDEPPPAFFGVPDEGPAAPASAPGPLLDDEEPELDELFVEESASAEDDEAAQVAALMAEIGASDDDLDLDLDLDIDIDDDPGDGDGSTLSGGNSNLLRRARTGLGSGALSSRLRRRK